MAIIDQIFTKVRRWLRTSPRVHVREHGVNSLTDVVDLIDRFVDGRMNYELEWDDFISWSHENSFIADVIERISQYEPLLFSKARSDRMKYISHLIEERNRVAAIVGLPARMPPASDA